MGVYQKSHPTIPKDLEGNLFVRIEKQLACINTYTYNSDMISNRRQSPSKRPTPNSVRDRIMFVFNCYVICSTYT